MGCGDWNDGMNRVRNQGRGESVWLSFFLYDVLTQFAQLARAHRDPAFAERCLAQARQLQQNIEQHAWDGQWYRRAYFDNGEPLGSQTYPECQIDSLPQSWSVISGAGDPQRSSQAMESVDQRLVRRDAGLVQMFDPPFDKSSLNPGYIKGCIPGVRENGGQYTHAALWSAMAFAALGEGDKAADLFSLLNPINRARTRTDVLRYKVEPYVVAADVYAAPPHVGRGGWTWYTGSAGWMQRAGVESILGLRIRGADLHLDPCIPKAWPRFEMRVRRQSARYDIVVDNPAGVSRGVQFAEIDGVEITERPLRLRMVDDGAVHRVRVALG